MVPPPDHVPAMALKGVVAARPAWGDADNKNTTNPGQAYLTAGDHVHLLVWFFLRTTALCALVHSFETNE